MLTVGEVVRLRDDDGHECYGRVLAVTLRPRSPAWALASVSSLVVSWYGGARRITARDAEGWAVVLGG
ncbi:hypothetical protein SuUB7_20490 [Streptococcus uberis]